MNQIDVKTNRQTPFTLKQLPVAGNIYEQFLQNLLLFKPPNFIDEVQPKNKNLPAEIGFETLLGDFGEADCGDINDLFERTHQS